MGKKYKWRFVEILPVLSLFFAALWLLFEPMGLTTAQAQPPTGLFKTYFPLLFRPGPLSWPTISLNQVVGGLAQPTSITHAGDNSSRIFVTEKPGRIRIIRNGALQPISFLDISAHIGNSPGGEQGLLSVAFPQGYGTTKNHFYVYYTNPGGTLVIARYRSTANPDLADSNNEEIILSIEHPTFSNHNGGQLQFGPDGYLYIGTGDGGSGGDPFKNGQNPAVLLGKLLRIDVESASAPSSYNIPATNPYVGTPGYRGEIWALGLRNPWRFSFDRQTGDLYLGDVGQNLWEEVNFQPANSGGGENYGWNILEGLHCYDPSVGCVAPPRYASPVTEYPHSPDCSITGGYVYRGPGHTAMQGIYFYGDICSGNIRGLQRLNGTWFNNLLTTAPFGISAFGEDQTGNLYVADYPGGSIYQITSQ
jgi:glucose/arabinose dehydrogenase